MLFRDFLYPPIQFRNRLAELLLARGVRGDVELSLHLGARETKRFYLARALGIPTLAALARPALLLFPLFHPLGKTGFRVDESFSGITHLLIIRSLWSLVFGLSLALPLAIRADAPAPRRRPTADHRLESNGDAPFHRARSLRACRP